MSGVIVWGIIILTNIFVFSVICRHKNWKEVKLSKIVLSSFISDVLFHIIMVLIDYEHKAEYLAWLPLSFLYLLIVGTASIIVFKTLFIFFSNKMKKI